MTASSSPLCLINPRHQARIGCVCFRCHDRLRDLLDPDQHGTPYNPQRPDDRWTPPSIPSLLARLDPRPRTSAPQAGGPSAFGSTAPADLEVIAIRDPRSTMLGLVEPARPPLVVLRALAARLAVNDTPRGLYAALDRLVRAPWVAEAWRELHTVHGQLRAATGDSRTPPVGTCRATVDDDGHETPAGRWRCAWPLWLPDLPPRAPDEPITLPMLRCGSCGHRYTGVELVALGRDREEAA